MENENKLPIIRRTSSIVGGEGREEFSIDLPTSPIMLTTAAVGDKKKKRKRISPFIPWRKPTDMPKRPLSVYNLFFKDQREAIVLAAANSKETKSSKNNDGERSKKTHRQRSSKGKTVGVGNLTRTIATKWKTLDAQAKAPYETRATIEKERYDKEMIIWRAKEKEMKGKLKKAPVPIANNPGINHAAGISTVSAWRQLKEFTNSIIREQNQNRTGANNPAFTQDHTVLDEKDDMSRRQLRTTCINDLNVKNNNNKKNKYHDLDYDNNNCRKICSMNADTPLSFSSLSQDNEDIAAVTNEFPLNPVVAVVKAQPSPHDNNYNEEKATIQIHHQQQQHEHQQSEDLHPYMSLYPVLLNYNTVASVSSESSSIIQQPKYSPCTVKKETTIFDQTSTLNDELIASLMAGSTSTFESMSATTSVSTSATATLTTVYDDAIVVKKEEEEEDDDDVNCLLSRPIRKSHETTAAKAGEQKIAVKGMVAPAVVPIASAPAASAAVAVVVAASSISSSSYPLVASSQSSSVTTTNNNNNNRLIKGSSRKRDRKQLGSQLIYDNPFGENEKEISLHKYHAITTPNKTTGIHDEENDNVEDDVDHDKNLRCARSCNEDAAFSGYIWNSSHCRPLLRVQRPLKIPRTYDHRSTDTNHSSTSALASASIEVDTTPPERTKSTSMASTAQLKELKFRVYQTDNWTEKFQELLQFRDENGHCRVPIVYPENPELSQWTKRQRYQYKLLQIDGKRSTITGERIRALDKAGFVWDSHESIWAERIDELKDFLKQFGHCNVPTRYEPNRQLAVWVKRQRQQRRKKMASQAHCMTDSKQEQLEALGFVWVIRKAKK